MTFNFLNVWLDFIAYTNGNVERKPFVWLRFSVACRCFFFLSLFYLKHIKKWFVCRTKFSNATKEKLQINAKTFAEHDLYWIRKRETEKRQQMWQRNMWSWLCILLVLNHTNQIWMRESEKVAHSMCISFLAT